MSHPLGLSIPQPPLRYRKVQPSVMNRGGGSPALEEDGDMDDVLRYDNLALKEDHTASSAFSLAHIGDLILTACRGIYHALQVTTMLILLIVGIGFLWIGIIAYQSDQKLSDIVNNTHQTTENAAVLSNEIRLLQPATRILELAGVVHITYLKYEKEITYLLNYTRSLMTEDNKELIFRDGRLIHESIDMFHRYLIRITGETPQ